MYKNEQIQQKQQHSSSNGTPPPPKNKQKQNKENKIQKCTKTQTCIINHFQSNISRKNILQVYSLHLNDCVLCEFYVSLQCKMCIYFPYSRRENYSFICFYLTFIMMCDLLFYCDAKVLGINVARAVNRCSCCIECCIHSHCVYDPMLLWLNSFVFKFLFNCK